MTLNLLSDAPGYTNPKLFESLNNLHSLNITSGNRFLFPYRTPQQGYVVYYAETLQTSLL